MNHAYGNPWAREYEPKHYTSNAKPVEHAGCQIFRVHPSQYDVVKSGMCIAQRVGLSGAKLCAEVVQGMDAPTFEDVRERMLARFGHY